MNDIFERVERTARPYIYGLVSRWALWSPAKRYGISFVLVVLLIAGVGILLQLYANSTVEVPRQGGNYSEAMVGLPRFVNPVLAQSNDIDRDLARLVYPSLLAYDTEGGLVPSLARSFEIQNGGREYIFSLREDAVWEDGMPITAEDIAFTIRLIQDPTYSSPLRQNWTGVTVETDDAHTIRFILAFPYVPFPENATVGILPKHIWNKVASQSFPLADANLRPIGAGPYMFEQFQKDSSGYILSYTLKRNDTYFGVAPFLDSVTFTFFETIEEAQRAYERKTVDGISFVPAPVAAQLENQRQTTLVTFTIPRYFALFFNESRAPALASARVREALRHATNKEEIIQDVLSGKGTVVNSPIPSFMDAFNEEAAVYVFDQERARALLEREGWVDKDGDGIREKGVREEATPLELTIATVEWPELKHAAQVLARQWEEVGARVVIEFFPIGELQQNVIRPREYQILLFGEVLSVDPDPFSFWHSSQKKDPGLNLSLYENNTVDKLLEEARQEQDPEARTRKLQDFQAQITADIPAIFLYNPDYIYAVNKNIKGVETGVIADPSWRFGNINMWFTQTKRIWK